MSDSKKQMMELSLEDIRCLAKASRSWRRDLGNLIRYEEHKKKQRPGVLPGWRDRVSRLTSLIEKLEARIPKHGGTSGETQRQSQG